MTQQLRTFLLRFQCWLACMSARIFPMPIVNDLLTGNRGGGPRVVLHWNWHATEFCMPCRRWWRRNLPKICATRSEFLLCLFKKSAASVVVVIAEGICVSHSSFTGADFCRRGGGGLAISGRLANRLVSWFGSNNIELLRGVIDPISSLDDCLNTVFDEVVSLRGICRNRCLATVPTGKASTFCISFWVCQKDFPQLQERNNLFVDRPV